MSGVTISRVKTVAVMAMAAVAMLTAASPAPAQVVPIFGNTAPGVVVSPDGTVSRRQVDEKSELAAMRARAKASADAGKAETTTAVSLPKAFSDAKVAIDAGKPVPDDAKYLRGLTRIDFLFVYPESNDLVIAGPGETVHVIDDQTAIGLKTGRPVMRLEDMAVALRVVDRLKNNQSFGCRLDPDPAAPGRINAVMAKMARASRADRVKAVADATGPQKVSFFGPVPADSRFALATIAADYELKRYGLGLAHSTVANLGSTVDASRPAVNMIWYELAYAPIVTTAAGDAFGLRGPRLKVQAGGFDWDTKGATPKAFEFAKRMTQNMDALAAAQPLIADLQNLADLTVVAALIRRDRMDRKAGWDASWVAGDAAAAFPIAKVTVPKTADALSNYTNGAIAAGGVVLTPAKVLAIPAEKDAGPLAAAAKKWRDGSRR